MASLQRRLDAGLVISLVLVFIFQWAAVSRFNRHLTEGHVVARLRQDSEGLLAALKMDAIDSKSMLIAERIDPVYQRPFSGRYFHIKIKDTTLRSRSLWDEGLVGLPSVNLGEEMEWHMLGPQKQPLLVLASMYQKQGQLITIAVAEDLSAIESELRRFQIRYAFLSLIILVALILIQRKIVRGGVAPIEKGRREVTALERGEITQLSETVPDEVLPFVKEINRLLEGMRQRLQRSRNATGNLAHALKAPLTMLMQMAERQELKNHPDIHRNLVEQTALLRRLIDKELKRARMAGSGQPGQRLDLKTEIDALFDALDKIYHGKKLEISRDVQSDLQLTIDREDFLELLGNLLDNACKWAKRHVALTVGCGEGIVLIEIEDDGPGIAPERLSQLAQRGRRLDESTEGHGLGLSIAKEIVAQYAGEIRFASSERLGGFQVTVKLKAG